MKKYHGPDDEEKSKFNSDKAEVNFVVLAKKIPHRQESS